MAHFVVAKFELQSKVKKLLLLLLLLVMKFYIPIDVIITNFMVLVCFCTKAVQFYATSSETVPNDHFRQNFRLGQLGGGVKKLMLGGSGSSDCCIKFTLVNDFNFVHQMGTVP